MKLPDKLTAMIAQENPAHRNQVSRAARLGYKTGLRDGRKQGFSDEDMRLIRWCVLTVSKGFTAEHDGQVAAAQLLTRIDGQDKRKALAEIARREEGA